MSDDNRDNNIENDANRRAHRRVLEKKRRDTISDAFFSLKDQLPASQDGKKPTSKAKILIQTADCIKHMKKKNAAHSADIEDLKQQNKAIEDQIRSLEEAKATKNAAAVLVATKPTSKIAPTSSFDGESNSNESFDNADDSKGGHSKRSKPN